MFCQCLLRKSVTTGYLTLVTWLPEKFAVKGKKLDLKNEGKGWEVQAVGPAEEDEKVKAGSRGYLDLNSIEPMV